MLEIVVLGDCSSDYRRRLQADVLRAKSALLYADHTIVESPIVQQVLASYMETVRRFSHAMMAIDNVSSAAALLADILEQRGLLPHRDAEFLRSPNFQASFEGIEAASSALRKGDTAFASNEHLQRFGPGAIRYYVDHVAAEKDERDKRAMRELVTLTETGLVTVNTNAGEAALRAEYSDIVTSVVVEFLGSMIDLLGNSTAAPNVMFSSPDKLTLMGDLGGKLLNLTANRATLAGELISSVPMFPEANVDEILDLRERLKPYLARFRRGVAELERELDQELARTDYHAALADLRLHHVDPALEELQQAIRDEDVQSTLARATTPSLVGSVLGLGVAISAGASTLTMALAVAAGLPVAVAKEFLERKANRKSMAQNRVFFLFDAGRRLKSLGLSCEGTA